MRKISKYAEKDAAGSTDSETPIVLYDGVCNLCTRSVQFVIQRDSRKQFRFASLQSLFANTYLGKNRQDDERLKSMVLVVGDHVYRESTAVLLTAKRLDGLWPMLAIFLLIPRPIRDVVYRLVAKHRYRVLGKGDQCWIPTPDLTDRFIDTASI